MSDENRSKCPFCGASGERLGESWQHQCGGMWHDRSVYPDDRIHKRSDDCILRQIATLTSRLKVAEEALRRLVALHAEPGEGPNDAFERVGMMFKNDTGMLRPGKDDPFSGQPDEDRVSEFKNWVNGIVSNARQALETLKSEGTK